jgi:ABC-2 type transport system permease protein
VPAVVWAGCRAQLKSVVQNNAFIFSAILYPLLQLALLVTLFRYAGRDDAILYAVVGSGVMGIWAATVFVTSWIVTSERGNGKLELLLAAPAALEWWLLGRALGSTVLALVSMLVTLVGARVIFGVSLTIAHPPLFLAMLLATTLAFTLFGTIIGGCFVLTRRAGLAANALLYPLFILSGVVFPLDVLPPLVRPLAFVNPLHWAAEGTRAALGGDRGTARVALLALVLLSAIFAAVARWCFAFIERRVRRDATLALD